jgi:D-sedoheptulose 7-phosphate isomerase
VDNRKLIQNYLSDMKNVIDGISVEDIDKAVGILFDAWKRGSTVYTCGNGGSASTATHFVCDLAKTTIVEGKRRFRAFCLNDNIPLVSALTNDNGYDNIYYEQLRGSFRKGDVLICISVHGGVGSDKAGLWSQNLIKAMKYAKDTGGRTIGLAGFDGGLMKKMADACIVTPVNSTPHAESLHLAMEHLICQCLKQRIMEHGESDIS